MYEIVDKERLGPGLILIKVSAPKMARKARPGQFAIVRADEQSERIPLSIAGWDDETVSMVFQEIGTSTRKLGALNKGDMILNLAGPLGEPSKIENYGTVVVASGCFGTGPGYVLARALKEAGCRVIYIIEARNRDYLFWLDRLRDLSDRLVVTCGDGSAEACSANGPLDQVLKDEKVNRVYCIGCTFMMMELSGIARPYGVETRVSLLPVMVDGTGMCGACRCNVGGEIKFGCIDGPEFDGQKVDWRLLIERSRSYLDDEMQSLDLWDRENWHKAAQYRPAA
ncbi:MAG TPA: sulfide/dihydroorotate dehydrogenase-like FAD/NAD-binding protein [Methanotrichaceae archaeon]|nr:sulfide/dihydroorotate dehydrogenase-like FAD/NAD-binding protein [Methanotrichaceae archaeon]